MDVGVGTGYYTAESARELAGTRTVCLVDVNPDALGMAGGRLEEAGYEGEVETVEHDVFKPLPEALHGRFDAVSMFFLLHCLPGAFPEKADKVVANFVPALTEDGTLYGATILGCGPGVEHNAIGRFLMRSYNQKRIFGNTADSEDGLRKALKRCFEHVEVRVHGTVALFAARRPLRNRDHSEYSVNSQDLRVVLSYLVARHSLLLP